MPCRSAACHGPCPAYIHTAWPHHSRTPALPALSSLAGRCRCPPRRRSSSSCRPRRQHRHHRHGLRASPCCSGSKACSLRSSPRSLLHQRECHRRRSPAQRQPPNPPAPQHVRAPQRSTRAVRCARGASWPPTIVIGSEVGCMDEKGEPSPRPAAPAGQGVLPVPAADGKEGFRMNSNSWCLYGGGTTEPR